jgi:hypothetical protein
MTLEIEVCVEHPRAVRTLEPLDSAVHLDVFVEVSPLSEAESAIGEGAAVGSLVGMNS